MLAVEPGSLRRPRLVVGCLVAAVLTTALVYLELPLRAGPFPAPLVYGRPDTWDGFWYIALAEQFRGALLGPFGDLAFKAGDLALRTIDAVRASGRPPARSRSRSRCSGSRGMRC